jgi:hypothetical protein
MAALDATAAAIQTALAALQATPTPSISSLDATVNRHLADADRIGANSHLHRKSQK